MRDLIPLRSHRTGSGQRPRSALNIRGRRERKDNSPVSREWLTDAVVNPSDSISEPHLDGIPPYIAYKPYPRNQPISSSSLAIPVPPTLPHFLSDNFQWGTPGTLSPGGRVSQGAAAHNLLTVVDGLSGSRANRRQRLSIRVESCC